MTVLPAAHTGQGSVGSHSQNPAAGRMAAKHGDIFPLPTPWEIGTAPRKGLNRRSQQRVHRRISHSRAAAECVDSLNCMFGSAGEKTSAAFLGSVRPTAVQASVLQRVWESTSSGPDEQFSPEAALRALLQADSYDIGQGSANGLATYVDGLVSLPHGQESGAVLQELLLGDALRDLTHVSSKMLLTGEELEGELTKGLPNTYHDPVLKHNRSKYKNFLKELYGCGVLKASDWVKVEVGIFFVKKKNGKLRLILDARKSNVYFRRPPSRNNSSLAALGNVRVHQGDKLYASQYDVKDFFYRLAIPWELSKHFGLPALSWDEALEVFGEVGIKGYAPGSRIHPYFCVLPMGFSWAFYLAQEALRSCVVRALGAPNFIVDHATAPDLLMSEALPPTLSKTIHADLFFCVYVYTYIYIYVVSGNTRKTSVPPNGAKQGTD
jgi:hypothetical protein